MSAHSEVETDRSRHEPLPIAVDAMGGDHAPRAQVTGALLARDDGIPVRLIGHRGQLTRLLPRNPPPVVHAEDVVTMEESAVAAVRRTDQSSVRVALREVAEGRAGGMVSCGNTGAVVVAAMFDLGTVEGVDRPAIASVLPRSDGGKLVLLDAGANVDARPEVLASFGGLGAAYARVLGMQEPRVGMLSNGSEEGKGNQQVRDTLPLLRQAGLNVVGHVEPTTALEGGCDVLVTDGFTGNILLKSAEATVQTAVQLLRAEISRSPVSLFGAWLLRGSLERFRRQVAWDAHGGAVLLGAQGTVVIGHGRATPEAVRQAIHLAHKTSSAGLLAQMGRVMPS